MPGKLEQLLAKARRPGRPPKVAGDTRAAILDAALALFAERGFFGTSTREIARRVGIRESGLYNHFANKDALLDALLASSEAAPQTQPPPELRPDDRLEDVLVAYVTRLLEFFATEHQRRLYRVLMADGLRLHQDGRVNFLERIGASQRQQLGAFFGRLRERGLLGDVDLEQAQMSFVAPLMLWRNLLEIAPALTGEPTTFARQHVGVLLHGIAAPPSAFEAPADADEIARRVSRA